MAVEFYDGTDTKRKSVLFSLDDKDFEHLQNTLSNFETLTGLNIDKYGRTRITHGHVKLIIDLLELRLKDKSSNRVKPSNKRLQEILNELKNTKNDLIAIGD